MNPAHLTRLVQGLRDDVDGLRQNFAFPLGRDNSFAFPAFTTTQDHDQGQSLESAWMLGQGEEDQPNADASCLLQNYWLRIDRDTDTQPLYAGTLQGRLDLRMNGEDAVLFCHAKAEQSDFTTELDFAHASFFIQSGTDETKYRSFQVSLEDDSEYLLSLARSEFAYFDITLRDDDANFALSRTETTGFLMTDSSSQTSMELKNGSAPVSVRLTGDATIEIATADVDGNGCKFHPWTRNGESLSPPLYVLSSGAGDLGGLPCVFQWESDSGTLGIGTDTDCTALQHFQIAMAHGLHVNAGGTTADFKLEAGSGSFEVAIGADENVSAAWVSGDAAISVGLGTGTNGIFLDFGGGLTVSLESGELASAGGGVHAVKFREIDVCDEGTPKKMLVLASEPY